MELRRPMSPPRTILLRGALATYAAAVGIFLVSALVAYGCYLTAHTTRLALVFVAGVLVSAVTLGARPAYLTAALAFLAYDFYVGEPRYSFAVTSPEEVLALIMFPFVAFLTGGLAGRARDEGRKANFREISANILYNASREISSIWDEADIRRHLAHHMAATADAPAMVWTDAESFIESRSAANPNERLSDPAQGDARGARPEDILASEPGWRVRLLHEADPTIGMAAWLANGDQPTDADQLVNVLVDLAAAAVIRARAGADKAELEAMVKMETLRSALLSSISHDFRTPLAVILASSSSLRALSGEMDAAAREDMLAAIQEEAERLSRFVTNLLNMAKLESGVVEPKRSVIDIAEVIERTVRRLDTGPREGRLRTRLDSRDMLVEGDPILLESALCNVVENALRFSLDDRPVCIRGVRLQDAVQIEVTDEGIGVAPEHLPHIFDKFYQADQAQTGRADGSGAGAGLGLSIARGLVEAMQGSIVALNRTDRPGLKVAIALPAHT